MKIPYWKEKENCWCCQGVEYPSIWCDTRKQNNFAKHECVDCKDAAKDFVGDTLMPSGRALISWKYKRRPSQIYNTIQAHQKCLDKSVKMISRRW